MDFVHLHVHSHYSLLDGLPKIDELVAAASARGFSALALTDHGNMYGAIEFYEACEKAGLKPIIGLEAYLTPGNLEDKNILENKLRHLVLLAENYTGYKNLMRLSSLAFLKGMNFKPCLDKAALRLYHEGLIVLSGCLDGEIAKLAETENNLAKAKAAALEYQEIFGRDNFYLELLDLPALDGQMETNSALIKLSKATGIPLVVTRDVHYLEPKDAEAQDTLTCIREGRTMEDPDRLSLADVDFSLASGSDIAGRFKHVPEALINTVKISERINLKLELNKWHFASMDLPAGKTADEYLIEQVYEKLPRLLTVTEEVKKRADYELDIIIKKGYSPYFLVVADYVDYARQNGIVETTRGSGAGSIVSFALGITTVNPLYFKLPFERFLNPFRPSPPDIDADFADDRRDEMIAYVTKKYGADKVAQIITFGTMMARGAVRDVGRALGYSYTFCDQVAKLIPFGAQGFQMTIARALELQPDLKELYQKNAQVKRLLDLAQKVEGCARHASVHAAGVVISPLPLTEFTPLQLESGGEKITTQYEMHSVEAAGLLKMDFLGIRSLSILGHAVEIVEKTTGRKIDIYSLPWDDQKTYAMLARGETVGVFQLSSSGMTRYLKELKPESIFDIMAMVALFRPGPMESIPEYIRRKNHPELIDYLDYRMKDYLDQSLGLIVYQDDVLLTAINLAGYNWEEADKFRKAMGKKIPAEMMKQKEKFFKGCKEYGKLPELKIHRLWELIEPFAAYGFNKAHAASYGVVAYQTAYLKANFPIQYLTAILIAESGDIDKVPGIIHECERMGVKVLPPDINESSKNFAMVYPASPPFQGGARGGLPSSVTSAPRSTATSPNLSLERRGNKTTEPHIRFGLNGIKNLGEHIAEVIYRERELRGKYQDLEDFLSRVKDKDLNKKSLESLIKCGALDSLGQDRNLLLANSENLLAFVRQAGESSTSHQNSLFSGTPIELSGKVRLEDAPAATADDKLRWEKELLGLYVTAHPFAGFQNILKSVLTPIKDLGGEPRDTWVVVGGVIDSVKRKITRSGKPMLFVTVQDVTSSLDLLVFPRVYETTKEIWTEGQAVCVLGKTGKTEGDDKLFVEKSYPLNKENAAALAEQLSVSSTLRQHADLSAEALAKASLPRGIPVVENSLTINLASVSEMKERAEEIKTVLRKYPGEKILYINAGGRKIKTSYQVDGSADLITELKNNCRVDCV